MTWSGMHTGREGEGNPTPLVERAVNHMTVGGGACRGAEGRGGGGCPLLRPDRRPETEGEEIQ